MWQTTNIIDWTTAPGMAAQAAAWDDGRAMMLTVSGSGGLDIDTSNAVPAGQTRLRMRPSAGVAYDPERHFFIGQVDGVSLFADLDEAAPVLTLRSAVVVLDDRDLAVAMRASALAQYHAHNRYCPGCGTLTRTDEMGKSRYCDGCSTPHFPRTDPAIIVAVTSEDDKILLGHNEGWEPNRYSVFAGFAEAGESLEQTVRREIAEEVRLTVTNVRYFGSQPWPMPRSLMVGFTATAEPGEHRIDGLEITAARWFAREELRAAVDNGEVLLPMRASIAHRLISDWYTRTGEQAQLPDQVRQF